MLWNTLELTKPVSVTLSTTLEHILPTYGNIRKMTDSSIRATMKGNRKCLKDDRISCLLGIAMQGHTDQQSNFLQLLKTR